ncbi:MAG: hypothetical protein K2K60_00060 [Clostridia bacterium]|nr:hypothetical protein [Clostridia bacterium]
MDRISGAVLDKINSVSQTGRYVIFTEDEFFECFPDGCERSTDELDKALTNLRGGGYIDIKYSRGDTYCVASLKEYVEETNEVAPVPEKPKRKLDFVFVSAFAGGALGSLLISLIFALI